MLRAPVVPPEVRRKADALGDAGHRWLDALPRTVDDLATAWNLTIGDVLTGGSAALVVTATAHDGRPAVLKLAMPDGLEGNGELERELAGVRAGQGHGYVELLAEDRDRRAVLLERLGRPLGELDLAVDDRLDCIAATVALGWSAPLPDELTRTGADQAAFLAAFVAERWARLDEPCAGAVLDEARRCAFARRDGYAEPRAVLVHADAHAGNVLADPPAADRWKLVDPDPMRSEPAHDLGIAVRDESEALLSSPAPAATLRSWCDRLSTHAGTHAGNDVDPGAIWQWAYVERVSTGLFLLELGDPSGASFLRAATVLLDG